MKAGTSQKIALNRITTTAMILAGRVRGSHMVELQATNEKLHTRAVRIVCELADIGISDAASLLEANDWHVGNALRAHERQAVAPEK
jgi:N-acetylmuramic acid 6-phosphate etherase